MSSASISPVSFDLNSAISLPLDLPISPVRSHFRSRFQSLSISSPLISLRSSRPLYFSPAFVLPPLYFLSHNLTYSPLTVNSSQPRLLFSFLSGLFSLFSTFVSSFHLIYVSILYSPRENSQSLLFLPQSPATYSPASYTRSHFCPSYSSILPLSIYLLYKSLPL